MQDVVAARKWYHPIALFWAFLGQWFLWGTGVAIVLAWRWPDVAKSGGIIRAEYSISYAAIAVIFLITGLTLSTRSLYAQSRNVRLHLHTQVTSLLLYPAVMFAVANIIRAAPHGAIDEYVLVGLVYLSCACTSVASNITMTVAGGGSGEAATVEVVLGNLLGVFLSPLLNLMFFSAPGWERGLPVTADGRSGLSGLPDIYRRQMMKMGLVLFVPMFVGQVVQNMFPKQTKWAATKLYLGKVSTFLLLLLMWSIFSTQFANNAFANLSAASIVLIVFVNLLSYLFWSAFAVLAGRVPFLPPSQPRVSACDPSAAAPRRGAGVATARALRMPKDEVTAVAYCAAAKGLAVAILVLEVLYSGLGERERAIMSIPFALYQVEQQVLSQLLTGVFRRWNQQPDVYFSDTIGRDSNVELPVVNDTGGGEVMDDKARISG